MKILAETAAGIEALAHEPFTDEARLQDLLEQYPDLVLAGTSDDEERGIWTIGREVQVPSGAIDLLLLDSTGCVWVVETKLAKNAEVRKQVVGQVLAYASDVATWSRDDLDQVADRYLASKGGPATLRELLSKPGDPEVVSDLIDRTVRRLGKGDLTALIAVDELNSVLRRLVEFVNSNARFTLLALKVETVKYAGTRLFIPTVVGINTPARAPIDDDTETYEDLVPAASQPAQELAQRLDALAEAQGWTTKVRKKSKGYHRADGQHLFWFFPKWSCIIFDLSHLRQHGQGEAADRIQGLASEIEGRPQGSSQPGLSAERLLADWGRFATELVPALLEAIADL